MDLLTIIAQASPEQLEPLPHIGPANAKRIIAAAQALRPDYDSSDSLDELAQLLRAQAHDIELLHAGLSQAKAQLESIKTQHQAASQRLALPIASSPANNADAAYGRAQALLNRAAARKLRAIYSHLHDQGAASDLRRIGSHGDVFQWLLDRVDLVGSESAH